MYPSNFPSEHLMPLRIFHAGELDAWNTPGIIDQNMDRAKAPRGFFY